jgi:hypothetical protein
MLVRLTYASRANDGITPEALTAILKTSRSHNLDAGITGVLVFSDGIFLQVLEGGRDAVSGLYNRIAQDRRHRDVVLLGYDEIAERRFAGWAMGQVQMTGVNPALLLKYSASATLDPYAVPGRVSMALFDDLVASASIACERGGAT